MQEPLGVIGAGWVGLVTAACFADLGHEVVVRDVVPERVAELEAGRVPIFEPGLAELLAANRERIRYTLDMPDVFERARMAFVCVDTPPTHSGDADLSRVSKVVEELPDLAERMILIMKSTVPVGTGALVRERLDRMGLAHVGYVSNPEFLAEGSGVHDFRNPDRIVAGVSREQDKPILERLLSPFTSNLIWMPVTSAEMTKHAINAFLATSVAFINEVAVLCEAMGADCREVERGFEPGGSLNGGRRHVRALPSRQRGTGGPDLVNYFTSLRKKQPRQIVEARRPYLP